MTRPRCALILGASSLGLGLALGAMASIVIGVVVVVAALVTARQP